MRKPKTQPEEEVSFDAGFAVLKRAVEEHFARQPPQDETVAPKPVRAETAADRDLIRAEIAYKIQSFLCSDPGRCAKHRCRRLSRCQELEDLASRVEELRAVVAKERAAAAAAADAGAAVAEAGRDAREGGRRRARAPDNRGTTRSRRQRKH